jgi:hypothetical protein
MLTYEDAAQMMKAARNGRRKLGNNTYLEERRFPGVHDASCIPSYAVRLHDTDVVTLHPDGSQTLNSGGWRTVTTKDRINAYSIAGVWSERGEWKVSTEKGWSPDQVAYNFAEWHARLPEWHRDWLWRRYFRDPAQGAPHG